MDELKTTAKLDRRQFIRLASLGGGGIFLVACLPAATTPTPQATSKPAQPAPTTPAKAKLSANVEFAATAGGQGLHMIPLLVAQEMFLKDEGISQKWTPLSGGGDTVRAVVTGGHQLGHPAPTATVIAFLEGQPIRIIAEGSPISSLFWVVKPDSPLKSMRDLKGKTLGYSRPGSISQTYAFSALRAVGLKPEEDVKLVAAGSPAEQVAAVKGGIIDVGWTIDPTLAELLLRNEVRIIGKSDEFIPDWSEAMVATTPDYAKANGDVLTAYLRALQKAMDFIKAEPEKAGEIWGKGTGVAPEVAKASMKNHNIQKFTTRISPAILKATADDMLANKQIKEAPDWKKIIDQSFLAPELRSQI